LFVFSGNNSDKAIVNPYKQIKKVRENSGVYFTQHDLRRTFATIADSLDIQHHIIKRLMNHTNNDVTIKHYVKPSIERLREPMNKIANYITQQV
jgi:integrase